jgi:hypothetical protein
MHGERRKSCGNYLQKKGKVLKINEYEGFVK